MPKNQKKVPTKKYRRDLNHAEFLDSIDFFSIIKNYLIILVYDGLLSHIFCEFAVFFFSGTFFTAPFVYAVCLPSVTALTVVFILVNIFVFIAGAYGSAGL